MVSGDVRVHSSEPASAVAAVYRRIETERMAGLPILNPALRVEALEFRLWEDLWIGVVITPWCMSLVLLPAPGCRWTSAKGDERVFYRFEAGTLAFLTSSEPDLGEFHTCALFSPMAQFPDQRTAVDTARAALEALFVPAQSVRSADDSSDGACANAKTVQSKRAFLKQVLALNSDR